MKKSCKLFLLLLSISILVVGCGKKDPVTVETPQGVETVEEVRDEIIVLGSQSDLVAGEKTNLYTNGALKVWESLITTGEDMTPQGKLATSWEVNEDFTEWTFHLREGVVFHDGETFNSDAVIANMERWKKYPDGVKNAYGRGSFNMNNTYPGFKEIVKDDEYTITMKFQEPVRNLDYMIAGVNSGMFSPKCFEGTEEGDFNGVAMGTGPFKLKEHKEGEYAVIERFDDYWGEKAKSKELKIKVIPDANSRFSALKAEEIMSTTDFGKLPPQLALELAEDDRFAYETKLSASHQFLRFNNSKFPFNNPEFKQALSLAIDREMINDEFFHGFGKATVGQITNLSPYYHDIPVEYNMEKAKELANGVLKGERVAVTLVMPGSQADQNEYKGMAEYYQVQFAELGLDVEILMMDMSALSELQKEGENYYMSLGTDISSIEPYATLQSRMHSKGTKNNTGYYNEEAERLLDSIENELDEKKRLDVYKRLQEIAVEDFPQLPIINSFNILTYSKQIEGHHIGPEGETIVDLQWAK